ncbi:winged helix-turn-helix domain-containing protein, partial [Enterococcus plantarum]|uniref:winged helix-turn-helix domain-containing protein n=1 Tax=Enterococcus plantarum TaxID=1077675 RepID=UPI001A8D0031
VMQIKKNSKAIIFLITDTNSRGIRLTYLNIGVDIILTKDLDSDEMYIEICKILNLINKEKISKYKNTEKPIFLVSDNRSIKLSEGKEVLLTKLEYKAMKLLVINKNKVLTYEQIFSHLWGGSSSNQNYRIANLIFHLRNKIKKKTNTNFIETIRSTGYMFVEENCYETTMDKLYERSN